MENKLITKKRSVVRTLLKRIFRVVLPGELFLFFVVAIWYALNIFIYFKTPILKILIYDFTSLNSLTRDGKDALAALFCIEVPCIEAVILYAIYIISRNIFEYISVIQRYVRLPLTKEERELLGLQNDCTYLRYINKCLQYQHFYMIEDSVDRILSIDIDIFTVIKDQVSPEIDVLRYPFTDHVRSTSK